MEAQGGEKWGIAGQWSSQNSHIYYLCPVRGIPINYNSNIKDHWTDHHDKSEQFEILQELPKGDRKTKWANAVEKNGAVRFAQGIVVTNLQFVKNTVLVKHDKAKHDKQDTPVRHIRADVNKIESKHTVENREQN